jgi:cytoskeletal protein RodZ
MPTLLEDRVDAPDGRASANHEITVRVVAESGGSGSNGPRPRRRLPSLGSIVAALGIGVLALVGFLIVGALTGLFSIGNPFSTATVDRSQPALLEQINNLSRFDAAEGKFTTTIDLEHDVAILPSFIAGDRTVFLAEGTVDASIDFSALSGDSVQPGTDGHIAITLPEPTLGKPVLDTNKSHVASRSRGLLNRIGGVFSDSPTSEREVTVLAQHKLASAAKDSKLVARAEKNTTAMLQTFLGRLGYTDVQVTYTTAPKKLG